ncbi:MAG: cytochrome b, partial [Methyloligellaceae bacterium]
LLVRSSHMSDRKEKLSPVTIGFHWLVAIAIISLIAFGLYIEDLPRGPWKSELIGIHKLIGFAVVLVALPRILWRWRNGWPVHVGDYRSWEKSLSKIVHWVLIIATVAMPVSGMMYSLGLGYPVPVLGLCEIGPWPQKNQTVADLGEFIHRNGGNALIAIVVLHIAGALKHHVIDKDGTLRRMLGARVG